MLIGVDGNEANVEKKVGIGEFAYQILVALATNKTSHDFKIYLKDSPRPDMPKESSYWKYSILTPRKLWTQWRLPLGLLLEKKKPDVFFSPSHYAPRFSPVSTVISIMDLSYLYFPELFNKHDLYQLRNWTAYSVQQASHIITISDSTKNDIIKQYRVRAQGITVIYPGIKQKSDMKHLMQANNLQEKYGFSGRYILFVGTIQPRKNIVRLIEAFSHIEEKKLMLLIVGKKGWQFEKILAAPQKYGVKDRVKFLDFVSDKDLPSFYSNAECFVLPSLYEGFGLPVLEAMKYRCPVIASNVSSLPEAGGDAALYCDPRNVHDITSKIEKILQNTQLQKQMREKGVKQAKKFNWERAARQVLSVLEMVGGTHAR